MLLQADVNGNTAVIDSFTIPAATPAPPPPLSPVVCAQQYSWRAGAEAQPSNAFGGLFFDIAAG